MFTISQQNPYINEFLKIFIMAALLSVMQLQIESIDDMLRIELQL